MVRNRGSLFYKILATFILLSLLPTLLTGARLLALNNHLLTEGGAGWSLAPAVVQQITRHLAVETISYLGYTLMIMALIAIFVSGELIGPLRQLHQAIERFHQGEATTSVYTATGGIKTRDEVGTLSSAFNHLVADLTELRHNLENQVRERTAALEERARQLEAASDVGRTITTIRNLDEVLPSICSLISERFGYYHVGIFLIDPRGDYAELRAANSPGGRRMLARRHRLKIGEQGIVGVAAATRQPRLAHDVGADAVYFDNPDLPETRSELALPLVVGDNLVGVLDVQSRSSFAFGEEDLTILRLLSDQVAVAIENARLFAENQQAIDSIRRAYGQLSEQGWRKLLRSRAGSGAQIGYRCTPGDLIDAVPQDWHPEQVQATESKRPIYTDNTLSLPIQLREETLGVVRLVKPEDAGTWSQKEINLMQTLADQLSVALESARLYDETQRRAERERLAGEITARMRASNDPRVILQTAVQEIRQALQAREVQALVYPAGPGVENLTPAGPVEPPTAGPVDNRPAGSPTQESPGMDADQTELGGIP